MVSAMTMMPDQNGNQITLYSNVWQIIAASKSLYVIETIADYANMKGACAVVKGLRAVSDFEYEFQQALTNKKLNPELETVFMTAEADNMYLSSSVVKQVCEFGGDISEFVPAEVCEDIIRRIKERNMFI